MALKEISKPCIVKEIYDALPAQGMGVQTFVRMSRGRASQDKVKTIIYVPNLVASVDGQKMELTPLPSRKLSTSSTQRQAVVCFGDFW